MEHKKQLIRLVNYTQTCLHELCDNVPLNQREQTGNSNRWAVKDHLAHVAHWQAHFNQRLAKREKASPPVKDVDQENARIFALYQSRPWGDVMQMLDHAWEELSKQLRLISEEELQASDILPSLSNRPLWQIINGQVCVHGLSHVGLIYAEMGNPGRAVEIQEKILEDLQSLDDSPRWRGNNIYNLSCACAIAGQVDRSLTLLAEALVVSPDLKQWAGEDPDLVLLHQNPQFIKMTS